MHFNVHFRRFISFSSSSHLDCIRHNEQCTSKERVRRPLVHRAPDEHYEFRQNYTVRLKRIYLSDFRSPTSFLRLSLSSHVEWQTQEEINISLK